MTKKLILTLTACLTVVASMACDVCGCSLSGLYFGFVPVQNTHFIGIKYSRATFHAFIDNDGFYYEDETSDDTYQRFDVVGRFNIGEKFQVRYIVPYSVNRMEGSHQNVNTSGLGDPIVMAYYTPINTGMDAGKLIKQSLNVGAGVKLPMGEHRKEDQGDIVNRNFQLGTGSLDYLVSANYVARYNKIGLNVEASYKLNTENSDGYLFGNQSNISGNVFYYLELGKLSLLPFTGLYYETADYHKNNGIIEANTGGDALMNTWGLQAFFGRMTINAQYQTPLSQTFHTDDFATIDGGDRLSVGVYYSFSLKGKSSE